MNILDDLKLQYRQGGIKQKLIFWNIGIYIISLALFYDFAQGRFNYPSWIALSSESPNLLFKPWTILTYAFLHGSFFHILFNLMILNFVGRMFLTFFTWKQFLGLYLLGAIFAGIVFVMSYSLIPSLSEGEVNMVGASGAIMAILIAVATYAPYMKVRLLLIGQVKLWHIVLVIVTLDLIQAPLGNTGGHIAHLGGAFFGFIYMKQLQRGTDLAKWLVRFISPVSIIFKTKKKTPFKKIYKSRTAANKMVNSEKEDKTQQQIDYILDKISKSGYDSLTREEKSFLFKIGKN